MKARGGRAANCAPHGVPHASDMQCLHCRQPAPGRRRCFGCDKQTIFKSADTSLLQIRAKDTLKRCYSAGALGALESPKKEDRSSGSRGWQSREQQRVRLRQWWRYGQDKVLTKMYFFMRDGQPRLPALLSSCTLRTNCRPGG